MRTLRCRHLAIVTIWWCIGLPMMLFLAALQQVPKDLYEAAALDNASRWRTLVSITLPSIRRTAVVVIVIELILQFQLFGQAQIMTLGGPNNASLPIVLFIYQVGFQRWDIGYAAAASEILFCIILLAAMTQYFAARGRRDGMTLPIPRPSGRQTQLGLGRRAGDVIARDGCTAAVDAAALAETQ